MANEYELKFLNVDKDKTRKKFLELGYKLIKKETLMRRQTYHLSKDNPEYEYKWGRVRDEGDKITATIKWYETETPENPSVSEIHEKEVTVNNWEEGVTWVTSQGFTPTSYQENTREVWKRPDVKTLEVTIDTWPGLNPYVEVEAKSVEEVKFYAEELGYDFAKGIAGGTEIVYELELGISQKTVKNLAEITFANPPRK